jgi:hypothetical protein
VSSIRGGIPSTEWSTTCLSGIDLTDRPSYRPA